MEFVESEHAEEISVSQEEAITEDDAHENNMVQEESMVQLDTDFEDIKPNQHNPEIFAEMNLQVPQYIINLLVRNGFTTIETVKLITKEILDDVESFAR